MVASPVPLVLTRVELPVVGVPEVEIEQVIVPEPPEIEVERTVRVWELLV
jgi:hypothetical protein